MNYIPIKKNQIQLFPIILCHMVGTGCCGPLFGFDVLPPIKDVDTGFEKISQPVFKQNNEEKLTDHFGSFDPFSSKGISKPNLFPPKPPAPIDLVDNFKSQPVVKPNKNVNKATNPFGSFDPFPSKDNIFKPILFTTTPPAPIDLVDNFKMIPELPLGFINKLPKDAKNSSRAPVKLDSRGSFGSNDDSSASKTTERTTKESESEGTGESFVTLEGLDIGTDYTTETSEYETTTDDEMGHIGGPAPAVVASLLG